MFEGKNIHYSQTDQKPLCSFSGKICNQRRLNNYGFCVRHILEDSSAPFKRCAYVAKSSRQTCTQPIPKTEQRQYCNNHMQVLGMLPKKERKPKLSKAAQIPCSHVGAMSDPGLLQNKLKLNQSAEDMVVKGNMAGHRMTAVKEDMDDIYDFPADSDKSTKDFTALLNNTSVSIVGPGNFSYGASMKSTSDSSSGTSSLAKIYPELAEKLEKIKPKIETKVKGKGKISRTMNSLQNKIAQNKIKDKLKRTQSSSNTSSQSQSPSHSFMSSSPGYHVNTSSPNHVVQHLLTHGERLPAGESPISHDGRSASQSSQLLHSTKNQNSLSSTLPSLSNLNILNGLNLQSLNLSLEQLGLPVPSVSDIEQTLKQLARAANISLEGTTQIDEKATSNSYKPNDGPGFTQPVIPPASLQNFTHLSGPPPPYSGVHRKPSAIVMHTATSKLTNSPVKADPAIGVQAVPTASGHFSTAPVPLVTRQLFSSVPQTVNMSVPLTSVTSSALCSISTMSSLSSAFSFASTMHPKLTLLTTSQPACTVMSASNQVVKSRDSVKSTKQSLPTPLAKPRPVKSKTKSRNASSAGGKRSLPAMLAMPMTMVKPRKIRKVLDEHEKKMLKKNARDLYERSIKRSIDHHHMIYSGVVSSDDSEVSDCDMLPWQSDWLTPSSDEEPVDEEDNDYTLRTAKLAIGRARRRRQCFQARHSLRQDSREHDVLCLVNAARESVRSSVLCLNEIAGKRKKSLDRRTRTGLLKRRCLYRDSDDFQCKHVVVPYTNHCNKHVMYNVDQQLFEYCTAKFSDNTQCCRPVIDVKHELPLCIEHGRKADNFLKSQDLEPKPKKPRKKTKPSALTRPPKKGKKKKNQRKAAQRPEVVQLSEDAADTDVLESSEENMSQHENDVRPESDHKEETPPVPQVTTVARTQPESSVTVNTTPSSASVDARSPVVVSDSMKKAVKAPERVVSAAGQVVNQEVKSGQLKTHTASFGQLEELEQLAGLELENVRMFGELETASKLLEENDFQDVFNKLPDEAFDIFSSKAGGLASTDDLQAFEDSLALANRELNAAKEPSSILLHSAPQLQTSRMGQRAPTAAILEDDITRQIAEEVLQQNLGAHIGSSLGDSLCNGDAEESIKAIARSLSNTGMMLAAEAKQKSQGHDMFGAHLYGVNQYGRSSSLPSYNTLEYFPPNVSFQNIPVSSSNVNVSVTTGVDVSKSGVPQVFPGHTQVSVVPQNVTVTPQGIITTHVPNVSDINMLNRKPGLAPFAQTVTIGNATVTGNQSSGTITLPGSQQLTAQQLSALVQQAAAHLPPLPPYKPRQQTVTKSSVAMQQQPTQIAIRPVMVTTSATSIVIPVGEMKTVPIAFTAASTSCPSVPKKYSGQDNLIQHLTRQQEQLGQQQQLIAQQILQQRISALNRGPLRVTLPSSQNLGFSTILQQGQIGQLGTMNASLVQTVPFTGQVTRQSTSTSQSGSSLLSVPSTNILWTSPPNVTITTPNGVPRPAPQLKSTSSNSKISMLLPSSGASVKETFIDLTDSDPPPSYEATQAVLAKTQPPPSYPVQTSAVTSDTAMS